MYVCVDSAARALLFFDSTDAAGFCVGLVLQTHVNVAWLASQYASTPVQNYQIAYWHLSTANNA